MRLVEFDGAVEMWGQRAPHKWPHRNAKEFVRLLLRGQHSGHKMSVTAVLRGSEFVGTVRTDLGNNPVRSMFPPSRV
jgi:hypothetical protein